MLTTGLDAYVNGQYDIALPALECVEHGAEGLQKNYAEFYLARIFSDDTGAFVDHPHAYSLFERLSEMNVDLDDIRRTAIVAKAITAVANYVRRGLPEIGLKPDLNLAVVYIRHAATFLSEPEAQFELAKLHLTGTGVPFDADLGLHYIQKLVHEGHAGAQLYLAKLHWHGKFVRTDRPRALALVKIAHENAPPSDRLWIDEKYQDFYCKTSSDERAKASVLVDLFHKIYVRSLSVGRDPQFSSAPTALGHLQPSPSRLCKNGEPIDMDLHGALKAPVLTNSAPMAASPLVQGLPPQNLPTGMYGKAP